MNRPKAVGAATRTAKPGDIPVAALRPPAHGGHLRAEK